MATAASLARNCRKVPRPILSSLPNPPTDNYTKIICIGRNYADHITELKNTAPKQPFFFLKPPTTLLPPKSGPVLLPRGVKTHFEVELGLVMGKTVTDFDEKVSGEKGAIGAIDSM